MIKISNYLMLGSMMFSVFLSKSLFNIFFTIAIFYLLISLIFRKVKENFKGIYIYLILIILGFLVNFLTNGFKGILEFIYKERYLIYLPMFMITNLSKEELKKMESFIVIGGLVALFYSSISYFTPYIFGIETLFYEYQKTNKMQSFQNGIRWARLLTLLSVFNFFYLKRKSLITNFILLINFYFIYWNIVINGQRAAILCSFLGGITFIFIYIIKFMNRKSNYILIISFISLIFAYTVISSDKMLKTRIESIYDIDENISNKIRLGYVNIGLDMMKENLFFGVGTNNIGSWEKEGAFRKFIEKQSDEYLEKNAKYHEGIPFENAYINMSVENGIIYLFYYFFLQSLILLSLARGYIVEKSMEYKIRLLAILIIIISDRIFSLFYPSVDMYVEFVVSYLIFYGLKISEKIEAKKQ